MSVFCRQRDMLLSHGIKIWVKSPITGRMREDQLKVWLEVEDYDARTELVTTRAGIFNRDDLQFINRHKEAPL